MNEDICIKAVDKKKCDHPVMTITNDSEGRIYKHAYSNKDSDAVIGIGEEYQVLKGQPEMYVRHGPSKFGEQLVLCFNVDEIGVTLPKKGARDLIEFYLPLEFGLDYLEQAVKYLKNGQVRKS